MAKIDMTIEDKNNGGVAVISKPPLQHIVDPSKNDGGLSPAQAVAAFALTRIHAKFAKGKRIIRLKEDYCPHCGGELPIT